MRENRGFHSAKALERCKAPCFASMDWVRQGKFGVNTALKHGSYSRYPWPNKHEAAAPVS
jgi:hypothetical protein